MKSKRIGLTLNQKEYQSLLEKIELIAPGLKPASICKSIIVKWIKAKNFKQLDFLKEMKQ